MSGGHVVDMAREEGSPEAAASGVDFYAQARKALSLRSPFDGEEAAARVPTLPARLANWAAQGDGRKKHKKAQPPEAGSSEKPPQPAAPAAAAGMWEQFEVYFRQITQEDIDTLVPKLPFTSNQLDSCLRVPFVGSGSELVEKDETFDVAVAETSSNLGVGGEELVSNKEQSEQSAELDMHEVVVQQEERPLEVEQEQAGTSGIASPEHEEDADSSLNWLLGAKDRFVLTSERPNKKRKLLGVDAGLDQLVLLPRLQAEADSSCDVCCLGESGTKSNRMLHCDTCEVSVHQKCYGVHVMPDGRWLCSWCKHLESAVRSSRRDGGSSGSTPCALCPKEKGALKPVKREPGRNADGGNLKFVHLFCSLWMPEVLVEDIEIMEPVTNIGAVQENRKKLVCNVCKIKHGACVRCSHGTCRTSFHPICARESKHQMEIWGKSGHDNVEMRAFCSKHSTVRDISTVQKSSNAAEEDSTEVRPKDANLVTGKIPKLRFTRKNKDRSMAHETTSSSSDNLIKIETVEMDTLPCTVRSVNSQAVQSKEMDIDRPSWGGNLMRSSADVAVVLRKLIDRGKVSVGDIASEVGISSESLEAALLGETTTFSPGLKLKIIKWLQNSVHMPAVQVKTLKDSSVVLQDNKLDGTEAINAANVKSPYVQGDEKGAAVDMPDSFLLKSSPPGRTNNRILKDDKAVCATGVTPLQNGNKKIVCEAADGGCSPAEDINKETDGKLSLLSSKDSVKEEEHQDLISNNTSGNKVLITPVELPNEKKGALVKMESNDLTEAQLGSELVEGVSSFDHCFSQGDNAKDGANSVENGFCSHRDFDADEFSGQPFFRSDGSHSYIHPFIKNKLAHLWDHNFEQNKWETYCCAKSSRPSDNQQHVQSSMNLEQKSDVAAVDQVSKAKSVGILEHSPDDEVEGEIVYLQARLLDNAIAVKQRYEDLILKVVQNLSHELDAFNKRKWDLILVNQFLREVREAKKRGRKERRHKEAQAVLAAAAAAIAASSRNSTLRKDADDDVASANQESPPKLGSGSSRFGQPTSSLPRTKDSSRSSNSKASPDSNSGIFHMPNFSKENALYCDVCMRSETVLNRVFVCSSCKAAVHLDCYHSLKNPTGPWKCELCEEMSSQAASPSNQSDCNGMNPCLAQCSLCGGTSGAFRKTIDGQWVHAFCAEWLLEAKFTRGQDNLVDGVDSLLKEKDTCSICFRNVGACLKCSYGDCHVTFHPSCARGAGFYMNAKGFGGMLQHKAYCGKHSIEQREADSQQYGPEELKSMKQNRVELEKLRLLCERIIKREKVKRDLVLCTHDELALKKDSVAFSLLKRTSFYAPGASSESATTSINNKSYSGTMQRSDDVTVDSTVSGKHTIRFSLHSRDADRNTADSSTSPLSFKRKLGDRGSLAGKQLPQRPATALQNSEDGEKKSKDKKHRETFQKELVMTSDQASMQNQRLPKGYVYVPRGTLSKEKTWNRGSEIHEPEEPGG